MTYRNEKSKYDIFKTEKLTHEALDAVAKIKIFITEHRYQLSQLISLIEKEKCRIRLKE